MPNRERQRVPDDRISPQESSCTPLGHGKSEYLRLNEKNENENRNEATLTPDVRAETVSSQESHDHVLQSIDN